MLSAHAALRLRFVVVAMKGDANTIDHLTRRVIQAAEKDLREFLRVTKLEQELIGILYVRLRHLIETCDNDGAVDEIALSVYLTASAWQGSAEPPVDLLPSLHKSIETTLKRELDPLMN